MPMSAAVLAPPAPAVTPPPDEPAAEPSIKSFEVIRPQLLVAFVERMNRRAKKLGLHPLTIEIGQGVVRQQTRQVSRISEGVIIDDPSSVQTYGVEVFPVKVSIAPVKLPGPWEFAARLDHEEKGNIIAAVPGIELPAHFRTAGCNCEHCQTKRTRNQTYVVRNTKENRYVQVGTDCIRDFLGQDSPELIAQQLAFTSNLTLLLDEAEESDREFGEGGGTGTGRYRDLESTLALANAVVRQHGYVSGAKEREDAMAGGHLSSTRRRVEQVMDDRKGDLRVKYAPTEADRALVAKVVSWVRNDLAVLPVLSDYQSNLVTVAGADSFNEKHLGIVVSAPSSYSREMDLIRERERQALVTHHVGVVGERVDFDLTLRKAIPLEGEYGLSTICIFEDASGNTVKWKASGSGPCDPGEHICLKGTIKEHALYKGVPQTIITRCKEIKEVKVLPTVRPAPVAPVPASSTEDALSLSRALVAPLVAESPVPVAGIAPALPGEF